MQEDWLIRERMLIGDLAVKTLNNSHVLVVGLGGVGGFAAECLCRAGVGHLTIVDGDEVEPSNKNRQLVALDSSKGKNKAMVLRDRLLDINPQLIIHCIPDYLNEEAMGSLIAPGRFDYVLDCIDTLSPKVSLISACIKASLPLVSAMGAGGKVDPEKIRICDISKSYQCTLAKTLRKRLHQQNIRTGFWVVFSPEEVDKSKVLETDGSRNKKSVIGTISWMPPLFGAYCASKAIRDLIELKNN